MLEGCSIWREMQEHERAGVHVGGKIAFPRAERSQAANQCEKSAAHCPKNRAVRMRLSHSSLHEGRLYIVGKHQHQLACVEFEMPELTFVMRMRRA